MKNYGLSKKEVKELRIQTMPVFKVEHDCIDGSKGFIRRCKKCSHVDYKHQLRKSNPKYKNCLIYFFCTVEGCSCISP
jgi:hypothetical protein